jgi:hypothetical protein
MVPPRSSVPRAFSVWLATLLVACVAWASLAAAARAEEPPAPVAVSAGAGLDWGVKASWRAYIGDAGTTLSDGATANPDGTFHFPVTGGSYDATTRTTVVRFGGAVQFLGHCEGAEPFERPCALDMTLTAPRVEISEDGAALFARMASRPMSGGEVVDHPDVRLAALSTEDATPTVDATSTTWDALPATVTLEASDIFTYTVGTVLDPVTFGYDGPGGKPAGETFAEPGAAIYDRQAVPGGAGDRPRFTVPGRTADELVGVHLGASRGLSVVDRDAFEVVPGSRDTTFSAAFGSVASEPATGTVLGATSGNGAGIVARRWDGTAWVDEPVAGSTIAGTSSAGAGVWDPAGQRYLVSRQVGSDSQLWQAARVSGAWTASKVGSVRQTTSLPAPLIQSMVVVPNGNPSSSAVVLASWFGQVHRLTFAPDGIVAEPLAQAPGVSAAKLVRVQNGVYAVAEGKVTYIPLNGSGWVTLGTAEPTITIPASVGLGTLDTGWVAADPGRNALFVPSHGLSRITRIEAGKVRHAFAIPGIDTLSYYADFLPGTTTAGDPVVASDARERPEDALVYARTTPSFTTQPTDATADVLTAGAEVPASFSVALAGDPAPAVRWQTRMPGQAAWSPVDGPGVSGADTTELHVVVGADDGGRQYRAIASNTAGEVASARATVEVRTRPGVAVQPDDVTVVAGSPAAFQVMPTGSPDPTVVWQQRIGGFWRDVDPESGDLTTDGGLLTIGAPGAAMDGTELRAKLQNALGTAYSRTVLLSVREPISERVEIRGGTVDWGVAERWRCYVVGTIARGGIDVGGGVTRTAGTLAEGPLCAGHDAGSEALRFPVLSGSYDPDGGKLSVRLGGTVRFWGHVPAGGGAPALDTTFSNLHVEGTGDVGTIYGDAVGATMDDPEPARHVDVPLVRVDLGGRGPTVTDAGLSWTPAPTTLTAEGAAVFGAYPAGEPFDPVALSLSGEAAPAPAGEDPAAGPASSPAIQVLQTIQQITQILPAPVPAVAAPPRPTIVPFSTRRALDASGRATIARVRCPATGGACEIGTPKRARITVGGRRYGVTLSHPGRVRAGGVALVRVRVPASARRALVGRTAALRTRVTVTCAGRTTARTAIVRLTAKRSTGAYLAAPTR